MALVIFNPDHDMALASNNSSFIPPLTAARMQEDLATLPYWYSCGDNILSRHDISSSMKEIAGITGISNSIICNSRQLASLKNEKVIPWGWNKSIATTLKNIGIVNIPDDNWLETVRTMSSRSFSIQLLDRLRYIEGTCGERELITDENRLKEMFPSKNEYILKSLWSNSGKGILWCRGNITQQTMNRAVADIKKYGGIIAEPIYQKEKDFAMEYRIEEGKASLIGYSLFNTNIYGVYESNEIMSDEAIRNELSRYISLELIDRANLIITEFINQNIAPHYEGCLGIDMMICRNHGGDGFLLHPCVEINLRMNMGIVAHEIYRRIVKEGSKGKYYIDYNKSTDKLKERDSLFKKQFPLVFENERIRSGYMSLTPIYRDTCYNAYIIIE